MANQIGNVLREPKAATAAVSGTAEHIKKFWDPRMRDAIFAHLEAGGSGLDAPGPPGHREFAAGR